MRVELRDYQVEAIDRVMDAEGRGIRRQLGVAPTGSGKTVIFCALAERRGKRTLILAHRDELIAQAAAKVAEMWPDSHAGIVKAEQNDVRANVVVASVQTLARPRRLAQLMAPFTDDGLLGRAEPFDLVICDEAHHGTSPSYKAIFEGLRCGEPDGPLLLGVTATPDRGDGKGLDGTFDEIVFAWDILWGIRSGYLSDMRGIRVVVEDLDLRGVKVSRGDFEAGAAGRALEDADAPRHIVAAWMEHALGRRTLVFTPTVETARLVADEFVRAGVRAAWASGETPLEERRAVLADFDAGRIDVLVNCQLYTEGTDVPRTDCIVVARPTKSRSFYAQMVGRGSRRHPDKQDCLVLDVVGASDLHSLVTVPSLFGLDAPKYRERLAEVGVAGLAQERDDDLVRAGRLRAEEADLFRQMRAEGLAWVAVHHEGALLRRYVLNLGRDRDGEPRPMVVLDQREAEQWTAGLQYQDGATRVLLANVGMETAQGAGEDWVRRFGGSAMTLVDTNAAWRKRPPSEKALAAAKSWRMPVDPSFNAGELSDALNAHIARKKARQGVKR